MQNCRTVVTGLIYTGWLAIFTSVEMIHIFKIPGRGVPGPYTPLDPHLLLIVEFHLTHQNVCILIVKRFSKWLK